MSLHYNDSSTFEVNTAFYDPFGGRYPGAHGEGKDYGVRFDFWSGKFSVRLNKYYNVLGPSRSDNKNNNFKSAFIAVESRVRALDPGLGARANWYAASTNYGEGNYQVYSDRRLQQRSDRPPRHRGAAALHPFLRLRLLTARYDPARRTAGGLLPSSTTGVARDDRHESLIKAWRDFVGRVSR